MREKCFVAPHVKRKSQLLDPDNYLAARPPPGQKKKKDQIIEGRRFVYKWVPVCVLITQGSIEFMENINYVDHFGEMRRRYLGEGQN